MGMNSMGMNFSGNEFHGNESHGNEFHRKWIPLGCIPLWSHIDCIGLPVDSLWTPYGLPRDSLGTPYGLSMDSLWTPIKDSPLLWPCMDWPLLTQTTAFSFFGGCALGTIAFHAFAVFYVLKNYRISDIYVFLDLAIDSLCFRFIERSLGRIWGLGIGTEWLVPVYVQFECI